MALRTERHSKRAQDTYVVPNGITVSVNETAYWNTATGALVTGAANVATMVAIGNYTDTVVGDGVKTVNVKFFRQRDVWSYPRGTIVLADRWKNVFINGQDSVLLTGTGGTHGRIITVDLVANTVQIEPAL